MLSSNISESIRALRKTSSRLIALYEKTLKSIEHEGAEEEETLSSERLGVSIEDDPRLDPRRYV